MPYTSLIDDARTFYSQLALNNKRDWWLENKATYDEQIKAPALAFLDEITPAVAALTDLPVISKIFRPHRDVRFSKDKTPYKTHLHMLWTVDCGARQNPVFFFGIGLDYVRTGAGMMRFEKPMLEDWRKFADLDADRMLKIIGGVEAQGYVLREPELKRVPSAYEKDHKAGHLLRMKGMIARGQVAPDVTDLPGTVLGQFADLWPVNALLIQIAEA